MSDEELTLLKERAKTLGISHSPNIGVEALKNKINDVLANDGKPEDDEGNPVDAVAPAAVTAAAPAAEPVLKTRAQEIQELRETQQKEQLALVRVRISCLNPAKAQVPGEIVTVGNKYIGTVRKLVPFGEATDAGYHIPRILYNELKGRKYNSVRTKKLPNGNVEVMQRLVPEFAIEVLEPLSPIELEQLARRQAAAAGL